MDMRPRLPRLAAVLCCCLGAVAANPTSAAECEERPEAKSEPSLLQSAYTVLPLRYQDGADSFGALQDDFDVERAATTEDDASEPSKVEALDGFKVEAASSIVAWKDTPDVPRSRWKGLLDSSAWRAWIDNAYLWLTLCQDIILFPLGIAIAFSLTKCICVSEAAHGGSRDAQRDAREMQSVEAVTSEKASAASQTSEDESDIELQVLVQSMYSECKGEISELHEQRSGTVGVLSTPEWTCSPLHLASHCGLAPIVSAMLLKGADVNVKDAWHETPLHFAARGGHMEVCSLLLAYDADVGAVSACGGSTPLEVAIQNGQEDVMMMLGAHAEVSDESD